MLPDFILYYKATAIKTIVYCLVATSCLTPLWPYGLQPTGPPWGISQERILRGLLLSSISSPRIFPTQVSKLQVSCTGRQIPITQPPRKPQLRLQRWTKPGIRSTIWNRIERPEINQRIYDHLICEIKEAIHNGEKSLHWWWWENWASYMENNGIRTFCNLNRK